MLCGRVGDVERAVRFTLERDSLVDARVLGAPDGASVALRQDCADPVSELRCVAEADGVAIEGIELGAGSWTAIVRTGEGAAAVLEISARPASCQLDPDCPQGMVCEQEECVPACVDDLACPGLLTCDLDSGHCMGPDVCQLDGECVGGLVCEHGECVEAECAVHADCPVDCVDRRCGEGPELECREDGHCPAPLRCLAGGQCLQAEPCAGDDGCPARAPRCQPETGRCHQCLDDGDCAAAEQCLYGACVFHGACAADADCPGAGVCGTSDRCNPGDGCAGDLLDARPAPVVLEHRTYTGLVLCDGDTDVYQTVLPGESALKVVLRHADGAGDLALTLSEQGVQLAHGDAAAGREELTLGARVAERTVEIRVSGRRGASAPYSLDIMRLSGRECPADPYEGPRGNDTAELATALELGTHALSLCPADADWFSVQLPAGGRFSATLEPSGDADPHTFALYDAALAEVAVSVVGGEEWRPERRLDFDVPTTGRYLLEVSSARPAEQLLPTVTLQLEAAEGGDATACAAPLPLVADEALRLPPTLPAAGLLPTSCGDGGTVWLASFELEEERLVQLEALSTLGGVTVALRADCADPDSELACGRDRLDGLRLPAGTWSLLVRAPAGSRPVLLLTLPEE